MPFGTAVSDPSFQDLGRVEVGTGGVETAGNKKARLWTVLDGFKANAECWCDYESIINNFSLELQFRNSILTGETLARGLHNAE
jgi:hypothetical protein